MNGLELELTGSELWDACERGADAIAAVTGTTRTAVMNRAKDLVRESKGGSAPEDIYVALDDLAAEALPAYEAGLTSVRTPQASQSRADREIMRLTAAPTGRPPSVTDVLALAAAPERVGDAFDDEYADAMADDDCTAAINAIVARNRKMFMDGRDFTRNPLVNGTPGSADDGRADPTDSAQPRKGGQVHPDYLAGVMARNPEYFSGPASTGNQTWDAGAAIQAGIAARSQRLGAWPGGATPGAFGEGAPGGYSTDPR